MPWRNDEQNNIDNFITPVRRRVSYRRVVDLPRAGDVDEDRNVRPLVNIENRRR
jgi:hypothetical protein